MLYVTRMPGKSYSGDFLPLSAREEEIRGNLRSSLKTVAVDIGERNIYRFDKLRETAAFITGDLENYGYTVEFQEYRTHDLPVRNIEAHSPGRKRSGGIVIVGAHYDSVQGCPGANDNGSGVAALLELARLLRHADHERNIRFVFFVNEEPPFFLTGEMGSQKYAERCRKRGEKIEAMFSLETIGYYSDTPGSQNYPFPFKGC